jgi:hypothetical protein
MKRKPLLERNWLRWGVLAAMLAVVLWVARFLGRLPDADVLAVPLGVEQAAIVTYGGGPIVVPPYKWGVAVSVRIANATHSGEGTVYDVRYLVNRAGVFDLRDYLAAEDGGRLSGLPSFKFQGDPKLSRDLDARIQETERVGIDIGGGYIATLWGLGALWVGWLLLLVFWGRRRPEVAQERVGVEDGLAVFLRQRLGELEAGTLGTAERARLEMLLLQHWRRRLGLGGRSMWSSVLEIGRHSEAGALMRLVEGWLHGPKPAVDGRELAVKLAGCLEPKAQPQEPLSTP